MVAGTALIGGDWSWGWRALLIVLIVWLTLPVASHVLARAALRERGEQSLPVHDPLRDPPA
jgi:multicomponent Na+:H+ antiporter subunit G